MDDIQKLKQENAQLRRELIESKLNAKNAEGGAGDISKSLSGMFAGLQTSLETITKNIGNYAVTRAVKMDTAKVNEAQCSILLNSDASVTVKFETANQAKEFYEKLNGKH